MLPKMVGPTENFIFSYRLWFLLNRKPFYKGIVLRSYSNNEHEVRKKDVSSVTMAPTYNRRETEKGWYDWWQSKGYFSPKEHKKVIPILLPPPNITGTLHLGHALTITIQDVFIRWLRMKGHSVLWIPGFDHGGIATHIVVERYLQKVLNVKRHDIGKEEFVKKVYEWKDEKEDKMTQQMKSLGASVDWGKKYFTMDEPTSKVVMEAFITLYNKGLIERRTDHVKWSCFLKSALSDAEVEWMEIQKPTRLRLPGYDKAVEFGDIFKFIYRVYEDGEEGQELVVATTRPETILGDTAVAVHPNDPRYGHLKGKFVWHPFRKCKIPILFDENVEPEFGTGVVKITPSHSPIDLTIGRKHNVEEIEVIDENGLMKAIGNYTELEGVNRFKAREIMINKMSNLGLFKGKEAHPTVIPLCSRTGDLIEYLVKPQWFLRCTDLYEKIRKIILDKEIDIEPEYLSDVLLEWFRKNIDWNLSRKLWWGHQIPMYECTAKDKTIWVPARSLDEAQTMASEKFQLDSSEIKITQDEDVLDTWFSSAVLPLAISGWPEENNSLYPLKIMETGRDIVFFWVARMLMLGLELTGKLPFNKVVLHGLICDNYGRKMSKSLGNVILPEFVIHGISLSELLSDTEKSFLLGILSPMEYKLSIEGQKKMFPSGIPECGTDALRLTLCSDKLKADQINFNTDICRSNGFFCNKLWQCVKFLLLSVNGRTELSADLNDIKFSLMDTWILSSLATAVESADRGIGDFHFHFAVLGAKEFFIQKLCDIYLENTKLVLKNDSDEDARRVISVLFNCLETSLRLFSPFMPFVTEELYHCLPKIGNFTPSESICIAEYPDPEKWKQYRNPEVDEVMQTFIEVLFTIRSIVNTYRLSDQKLKVILKCPDKLDGLFSNELTRYLRERGRIVEIHRAVGEIPDKNVIVKNLKECSLHLYHKHDKNTLREMFRPVLEKEEKLKQSLELLNRVVSQENYINETSADTRGKNSATLSKLIEQLKKIEEVKGTISKARS